MMQRIVQGTCPFCDQGVGGSVRCYRVGMAMRGGANDRCVRKAVDRASHLVFYVVARWSMTKLPFQWAAALESETIFLCMMFYLRVLAAGHIFKSHHHSEFFVRWGGVGRNFWLSSCLYVFCIRPFASCVRSSKRNT